jgi:hypothetical protein
LDDNRDVRFAYPYRVPITQSAEEYCEKVKAGEPIVHYNKITQILTINVNNIDFLSFADPERAIGYDLTFDFPFITTNVEMRMKGIQGKLQLSKRSSTNEIISSSFTNAEMLVQVSETLNVQCSLLIENQGPVQDTSFVINYRTDDGLYAGAVIPLLNGGSPALDIYIANPIFEFPNAVAPPIDPWLTMHSEIGDNSNTLVKELYALPSQILMIDSDLWDTFIPVFPVEFIDNPPIPEDVSNYPLPSSPNGVQVLSIMNHEFMHNIHSGQGTYLHVDAEAQAVGVEMDTNLNLGAYLSLRPWDFAQFVSNSARGRWPFLAIDSNLTFAATYGGGMWWNYFAKFCDPYHQVMRRSLDIIGSVKLATQSQYVSTAWQINFLTYYRGAYLLSVQQAMQELKSLDISDVYRDFAISLSLVRNNASIPEQYRSFYPYWLQQTAYSEAGTIANSSVKYWWSELDENITPSPAALTNGFVSMLPQLDDGFNEQIELEDCTSHFYVVDKNLTSVSVTSNMGRIVVTMHQFDSGVPNNDGTFTIQGPFELNVNDTKMFNLADFTGSGIVRLVVSNLTVTDYGAFDNLFNTDVDRIQGKATITSSS